MDSLTLGGLVAALLVVGVLAGWLASSLLGARSLRSARSTAEEILHHAQQDAERDKKSAALAVREEVQQARQRAEKELQDHKSQIGRRQVEIQAAAKAAERQQAEIERRSADLETRLQETDKTRAQLDEERLKLEALIQEQDTRLQAITGLSLEDARQTLMESVRKQSRFEAARIVKELREEAHGQAEAEAQKIMALAVERSASDFSTTRTTSAIILEDDKIKGRLIGHEGKNIKAFEAASGMQLVVDDTPNQVIISGFHPVKREIARLTLEKLIKDGNIHPRRIEETLRKMRKRTASTMRTAAEAALKEIGVRKVHPEMVDIFGRLHYRTSYGQNVMEHSKEVAYLTGIMAVELGLDERLARRAGLFHDIGKAIDYEREGTHPEIGEEVARRYNEPEVVVNAIASHHEDCEVISPISILVAAADALSGARPGARRRTLADYIRRVEKLETIAGSFPGVSSSYAIQAGRELRVIACHDQVSDEDSAMLATDIAERIQAEVDYPGKIKVTVIREMWATQQAR